MSNTENESKVTARFDDPESISVAVVTGEHPFDVPNFHRLFKSFSQMEIYIQHLDQFAKDWGKVRDDYDVVVFFNWHLDTPPAIEKGWWQQGTTEVLKQLGNQEQGIVVLHHAITAFPQWEFWSQLMGNRHEERSWHFENLGDLVKELSFDETLHIEIADSDDPITAGLVPWDIRGETWGPTIGGFPGPDCHVLLTTNHPKMRMKAIAWKLQFRRSRVFCFQPGHDNYSWADKNFRKVLLRGIQWAACRQ